MYMNFLVCGFFLFLDYILMIDENIKKVKFYLNFCFKCLKVC